MRVYEIRPYERRRISPYERRRISPYDNSTPCEVSGRIFCPGRKGFFVPGSSPGQALARKELALSRRRDVLRGGVTGCAALNAELDYFSNPCYLIAARLKMRSVKAESNV
jgi:hypothetical protein